MNLLNSRLVSLYTLPEYFIVWQTSGESNCANFGNHGTGQVLLKKENNNSAVA
jgi:hypothetical protein